jgi:hypothetical protein
MISGDYLTHVGLDGLPQKRFCAQDSGIAVGIEAIVVNSGGRMNEMIVRS